MEPSDADPSAPFNWTEDEEDVAAQRADERAQDWQDSRED